MNRYEQLLDDLIKKTKNKNLNWELTNINYYEKYIFNSQYVYQLFKTIYEIENKEYTLLLIQRKLPIHNEDIDISYDTISIEVLVIFNDKLIFNLNERYVDKPDLFTLSDYVENLNKDTHTFFEDFELSLAR